MTCDADKSKMVFLLKGDGEYVPNTAWGTRGGLLAMPSKGGEVQACVEELYEQFDALIGTPEELLLARLLKIYALLRDLVAEFATPEQTRTYDPPRVYVDFREHIVFTDEERTDGIEGRDLHLPPAAVACEGARPWLEADHAVSDTYEKFANFYLSDASEYFPAAGSDIEEVLINTIAHTDDVAALIVEFFDEVELLPTASTQQELLHRLVRFYVIGRDLVTQVGSTEQRATYAPPLVYRAKGGKIIFTPNRHPRAPEGRGGFPHRPTTEKTAPPTPKKSKA